MRRFKIGDRVVVKMETRMFPENFGNEYAVASSYCGLHGGILEYTGDGYDYLIRFDNDRAASFADKELDGE